MVDGNIHDCLSSLISEFFNHEELKEVRKIKYIIYIQIVEVKNQFKTITFSQIFGKLVVDSNQNEAEISESMFNLIVFNNKNFILHKIKGNVINAKFIKEIKNILVN